MRSSLPLMPAPPASRGENASGKGDPKPNAREDLAGTAPHPGTPRGEETLQRRGPTEAELGAGLGVGEEDVVGALGANELSRLKRLDEPWVTPGDQEAESRAERLGVVDPRLEAVEHHVAFQQVMKRLPPRLR